jgi:hypothetical protein
MKRKPKIEKVERMHAANGYSPNALSVYTRHCAYGKLGGLPKHISSGLSLNKKIERTINGLRELEADLLIADSLAERQKVNHNLSIKYQFLKELQETQKSLIGHAGTRAG